MHNTTSRPGQVKISEYKKIEILGLEKNSKSKTRVHRVAVTVQTLIKGLGTF